MILTGSEITTQLGNNILIEPFNPDCLNPNSYNLSLHNELLVYEEIVLDMQRPNRFRRYTIPPEGFVLNPNQLYLARTVERTETHNLVPMIEGRSCEKFQILAESLVSVDAPLAKFYAGLVESEGNHYAAYLLMAKEIDESETNRRLDFYLDLDAELVQKPTDLYILH